MSIKSDKWIRKMSLNNKMINPFTDNQIRKGTISYGLSSYGYDIRVSDEYKIFNSEANKKIKDKMYSSYDLLLNNKYKVKINQKTLERVKNYYK